MLEYRKDISLIFSLIAECLEEYTPKNSDFNLSNDERISTQDLFDAFDDFEDGGVYKLEDAE